ncbi:hypothetical protein [Streptomyces sp. G-G2]|uniref:hypothetical protein n=1 Tax=Streptomyces sp. G-G2 TaxID=3046201 RepID=UPI0024B92176|nr:hypothetical protein [Streptomyces sp. G-G2]MDJ0379961.1 hypothetical protein [Streptomyces sp. G-G2]
MTRARHARLFRTPRTPGTHLHPSYEETPRGTAEQALERGTRRAHLDPAAPPGRGRRRRAGTPPAGSGAEQKIEPALRTRLDDGKAASWVCLGSAADLTAAAKQPTRATKAEAVFRAKKDHAARTQAQLLKALDGARAEYTSYWIVNAVRVVGGDKLAGTLARRP